MFVEAIKGEIVAALAASSANSSPAIPWYPKNFFSWEVVDYETSNFGD